MNIQQTTKEPLLQYAILCDAVAKDQFGKPVYIGAFDRLTQVGIIPQFVVAVKWIYGIGVHTFNFRILDPNLQEKPSAKESNNTDIKIELKTKLDSYHFAIVIVNFNFNTPGVYWVEFFLNNNSYLSIPLPVHKT